MRICEDKEKYMKYYLDSLLSLEGLRINAIKIMAEYKGEGDEYIASSFDPDDEEYKEGYVALFFWKPADSEDTLVYVETDFFYKELEKICNEDIKKNPEHKLLLNKCLETISAELGI